MGWFWFNGKDSRDFGVLIATAPERIRPERRVEEITIPGRNGALTRDEGTYEPYTLSMECSTRGADRLAEIVAWLDGAGDLVLSTEPDKVYRATIFNQIAIADIIYLYNSFLLQFRVQPFKYRVNPEQDLIETDTDDWFIHQYVVNNPGTVYAEPIFTLTGYGVARVSITQETSGEVCTFRVRMNGEVTVNAELMEVYSGEVNKNGDFTGDFPKIAPGENKIRILGDLEHIKIQPNWRWL